MTGTIFFGSAFLCARLTPNAEMHRPGNVVLIASRVHRPIPSKPFRSAATPLHRSGKVQQGFS